MSAIYPNQENAYCGMYDYIMDTLELRDKNKILLMQNKLGLRPLELAAGLNTFHMFLRIWNTEGVYRFTKAIRGLNRKCWYDVTEYEDRKHPCNIAKRVDHSPFLALSLLCANSLNIMPRSCQDIISDPGMKEWMRKKFIKNIPVLLIWCMVRVTYSCCFFI